MSEIREQCVASEADWYVEVIFGKTYCPCLGRCKPELRDNHERQYGTETDSNYSYFKGGQRPTLAEINTLVPNGYYRIESTVKEIER
jgi:hypothetical protein